MSSIRLEVSGSDFCIVEHLTTSRPNEVWAAVQRAALSATSSKNLAINVFDDQGCILVRTSVRTVRKVIARAYERNAEVQS